jgi:hypothetical protein
MTATTVVVLREFVPFFVVLCSSCCVYIFSLSLHLHNSTQSVG